ncbi:MAG: D-alanyl-D-alanine carboxypeptidase/D-alanyl-D-alanine-endopeptidase [Phycisphaerae bacterium]|nr:D-alanyl-D-alanine carboxypeptidase/D-alanyl-D-alanine-endopeptidase [Phycisphaerae bacterium]
MDAIAPDTRTSYGPGRLSFRCVLLLAVALVAGPIPPVAGDSDSTATLLRSHLDRILTSHKQPKAQLGARVVELPAGRVLYDRAGHRPMLPASNMKLIVMAAAIDQLGKDCQFKTVLAIRGADLIVIGGGDPTIGDERLARQRGHTITAVFHDWAATLKAAGIKQVPGNIVIDDSIFDRQFVHPDWPSDQFQKWYEAPVGGLNFNANCTAVRVCPTTPGEPATVSLVPGNTLLRLVNKTVTGERQKKKKATVSRKRGSDTILVSGPVAKEGVLGPVTVRDPGLYFGHVLKTCLAAKGIRVVGGVVREEVRHNDGSVPVDCHIVAVHRSPLADALSRAGKQSLGMMAEALVKLLGSEQGSAGSWENGRLAVNAFMRKVGVPPDQFTVSDGSGLSRANRLSPAAATQVLQYMFNAPDGKFELLRDSLACAGVDGTMEKRLRAPDTKGRVFAKTGYIKGVRTLAGYVHTASDRWLAFAFYYHQAVKPAEMKKLQDEACRLLVSWPDVNASAQNG